MSSNQVLSPEAKIYAEAYIKAQDDWKEWLRTQLEDVLCVACYDDEPVEDWIESYVTSVEAGDVEIDFSLAAAKSLGHATYTAWLDIDEVWVD